LRHVLTRAFPRVPTIWLLVLSVGCLWLAWVFGSMLAEALRTGVLTVGGKGPVESIVRSVNPQRFLGYVTFEIVVFAVPTILGVLFGCTALSRLFFPSRTKE